MCSGLSLGFLYGWNDSEFRQKIMSKRFIDIFLVFQACCHKRADFLPKSIQGAFRGRLYHYLSIISV